MRGDRVLARAYGDEPLDWVVWAAQGDKVALCHSDHVDRALRGETWPMPFPAEDVFEFDEGLFERLGLGYQQRSPELLALWQQAHPYQLDPN